MSLYGTHSIGAKAVKSYIWGWSSPVQAPVRSPHAGSWVVRIDPLRFLARCHARWLNQALSVHSLSLVFLSVSVVLLTRAPFWVVSFCIICALCLLVVPVRLSVPVQVTDWLSKMIYNVLIGTLNPAHSLTHSLTMATEHSACQVHIVSWGLLRWTCLIRK